MTNHNFVQPTPTIRWAGDVARGTKASAAAKTEETFAATALSARLAPVTVCRSVRLEMIRARRTHLERLDATRPGAIADRDWRALHSVALAKVAGRVQGDDRTVSRILYRGRFARELGLT